MYHVVISICRDILQSVVLNYIRWMHKVVNLNKNSIQLVDGLIIPTSARPTFPLIIKLCISIIRHDTQ